MFVYSWNVSKDGVGPITQVFTNSSGESLGGRVLRSNVADKDELKLIYRYMYK